MLRINLTSIDIHIIYIYIYIRSKWGIPKKRPSSKERMHNQNKPPNPPFRNASFQAKASQTKIRPGYGCTAKNTWKCHLRLRASAPKTLSSRVGNIMIVWSICNWMQAVSDVSPSFTPHLSPGSLSVMRFRKGLERPAGQWTSKRATYKPGSHGVKSGAS